MPSAAIDPEPGAQQKPVAQPTTITEDTVTEERDLLKIALVIIAAVVIVVVGLFFALSRINAKGGSASSGSSSTVSQSSIYGVTVYVGAPSYVGNGTVYVSGAISPLEGPNSNAIITVTAPGGTAVQTKSVPVLNTGYYSLAFQAGGTSWVNGVYTVTVSYYGSGSTSKFNWTGGPQSAQPSSSSAGSASAPSTIQGVLCNIYSTVHSAIFLLGLVLIILGAAIYAFAHIMPGSHKSSFQGYGMGMVIGGVVGVIIAVLAPYILTLISGNSLPIASCVQSLI